MQFKPQKMLICYIKKLKIHSRKKKTMKRMHSYWLSSAVVATIAFAGFAIAQQKMSMPDAAPVAQAPDAAAVVAPASAPQLDNAAIQALPIGAERGRIIAMQPGACFTCHSGTGDSVIPANPKLAGQHEAYLEKQLHDFKVAEGAEKAMRVNTTMNGMAAGLSEGDIKSLAAWFASQKQTPVPAQIDARDMSDLGKKIFFGGVASKGLPACAACHGPTGAGIAAKYPRVSGQFASYLEKQLKGFRDDKLPEGRANNEAMMQISKRMTDTEIKAVADYMAGVR
jgi:cytochrome c553